MLSARLKGRRREVDGLVDAVAEWARQRPDPRAVGLVGSYAYQAPRLGSDVDFVFVTAEPTLYTQRLDWTEPIEPVRLIRTASWGPLTERRFRRRSGLHVEVGIAPLTWASTDPLDPGTARVISDGLRIVHDPDGLLDGARVAAGGFER